MVPWNGDVLMLVVVSVVICGFCLVMCWCDLWSVESLVCMCPVVCVCVCTRPGVQVSVFNHKNTSVCIIFFF